MSRSYKKTPCVGDRKGKIKKRIANHTVRAKLKQDLDFTIHQSNFKKMYEQWNICDFKSILSWEEYWEEEWRVYHYLSAMHPDQEISKPDKRMCYRKWRKAFYNKQASYDLVVQLVRTEDCNSSDLSSTLSEVLMKIKED